MEFNGSNGQPNSGIRREHLLRKILEIMEETNHSLKHKRCWYLECLKMAYGEESPEFQRAIRLPAGELLNQRE